MGIADTAGHCGRDENEVAVAPGPKGEKEWEGKWLSYSSGVSRCGARVLVLWLELGDL